MDQRRRSRGGGGREFEDFDPAVEWKVAGEEQDVVEISLPGFRKDQVRVQVDNHGVLRATGERPARGGRWARFKKDLRLPENCDADAVRARFEAEKLIITLPIVPPPRAPPSPTPSPEPGTPTPTTSPPPGPPRWPLSVYAKPLQPPKEPPRPSPTLPPPPPPEEDGRVSWTLPETLHGMGYAKTVLKVEKKPTPRLRAEEAPKKPLQGTKAPEEDGRVSRALPEALRGMGYARMAHEVEKKPPPGPISVPPLPRSTRQAEEAPKKPLQDTKAPEEDGRVSRALLRGIVDDAGTASGKNQAPTTVATAMVPPEQGRQLLVNAVAAAAVLVGIVWWAWRNLSS